MNPPGSASSPIWGALVRRTSSRPVVYGQQDDGDGQGVEVGDVAARRAAARPGEGIGEAAAAVGAVRVFGGGGVLGHDYLPAAAARGGRVGGALILELGGVEAGVGAVGGQELGVGAALDDAAPVDDQDEVGGEDGGKAVGDGEGRAARHQRRQGALDQALGLGVQGGGGFVQDQDAGVLQDGAGDGDALLLAAGELVAALADDRIVAVRQAGDVVVDGRRLRRRSSSSSVASGRP